MVLLPSSTQSRISATIGLYGEDVERVLSASLLGALARLRAEDAGGLDELLDGDGVFAGRLQQIDADGAADRHRHVGRIGVELLQTGDELEPGDLAGGGGLALGARGEAGAGGV